MTEKKPLEQRMRELNDNARFQLVGRTASVFGVPAILGLIGWALFLLVSVSQDVAVMKAKLEAATSDPYHATDARRDFALRDNMITNNGKAIDSYGRRIEALELESSRR